jgi:hypothetical protein
MDSVALDCKVFRSSNPAHDHDARMAATDSLGTGRPPGGELFAPQRATRQERS